MILFETLNQPKILVCIIFCGFFCGLFFDVCNLIVFLCNNNKITKNIFQCISTILCFFVLFFVNSKINYGQMRLYILVFFVLSIFLERISVGKIIAKTYNWCYTQFEKVINTLTKVKNKWITKRKNSK